MFFTSSEDKVTLNGTQAFLSVVIPAYNEESRLPATLAELQKIITKISVEIIVVCDGCTDGTIGILNRWMDILPLKIISYSKNKGKGYAVRQGVLAASGEIIAFMDADGSTPPSELLRLIKPIKDGKADMVIGSRRAEGAHVKKQPPGRHLLGKLFSLFTKSILSLPYKDTQCGFKLFDRAIAKKLFSRASYDGFEFDLDILYMAHADGLRVIEAGVEWNDCSGSKVDTIRDGLSMLQAVINIRLRHILGIAKTKIDVKSVAEEIVDVDIMSNSFR